MSSVKSSVPLSERATIGYADREDRIKILAEIPGGATIVLWLTQRLTNKLIPHLTSRLPNQAPNERLLRRESESDAPETEVVPVQEALVVSTLVVDSVDISETGSLTLLQFRSDDDREGLPAVRVALDVSQLASWLHALRACYQKASWNQSPWAALNDRDYVEATPSNFTVH